MKLIEKEFLAKTLPDKDPKHQGRYKVYIPEFMYHILDTKGIWVKNHVHKHRITRSDVPAFKMYGQYFPLQSDTIVIVKFFRNDYNTGYIDRIVSDYEIESLPLAVTDRDDLTQMYRTPKYDNIHTIHEDTVDQPPNSIHIYYNQVRTTIVVDEEGIHIHSDDNEDKRIKKDYDQNVKQNKKVHVEGDFDVYVNGNCRNYSGGYYDIRSAQNIAEDAPMIYLNCGIAGTAKKAEIPERTYGQKSKSTSAETHMILDSDSKKKEHKFFEIPISKDTLSTINYK